MFGRHPIGEEIDTSHPESVSCSGESKKALGRLQGASVLATRFSSPNLTEHTHEDSCRLAFKYGMMQHIM